MIRIFIADDHSMIRDGVKFLIADADDIELIGEAVDGKEAVEKIGQLLPDVAIIDINMPEMNGLEVIAAVKDKYPEVRTLVFSIHNEEQYMVKSIKFGAHGYLLKDAEQEEFLTAIRTIAEGGKYFGKLAGELLLQSYISKLESPAESPQDVLTSREKEILRLVVEGQNSRQIGGKLFISTRTVDNHRANIMHKLDIHTTPELVNYAIKHNLI